MSVGLLNFQLCKGVQAAGFLLLFEHLFLDMNLNKI
jgi:hypothetical protein